MFFLRNFKTVNLIVKTNNIKNISQQSQTTFKKYLNTTQTIWSQNSNKTKDDANSDKKDDKMDHFKSNPYFSKYEAKLKNLYK